MVEFFGGAYSPGQEQHFKTDYLKFVNSDSDSDSGWKWFCIESESTVPGFPDVIGFKTSGLGMYQLLEFKVSDAQGIITFEKSQPLFYKRHSDLNIRIVAWDVPRKRLVNISSDEIVAAKTLRFKIPKAGMKQT